jgi:DNA-binding transcriptional MerR regulator
VRLMTDDTKFYSVGELAKKAGIKRNTVEHYLKEGLLETEVSLDIGHGLFTNKGLERLKEIIDLRRKGYSIEEIRNMLGRLP